jgi:hypothetical protein
VLRDAWTGAENSTDDAARLVRGLRAVTNQGATVLLLHHTGKPGERPRSLRHQVRGSSVLVDAADSLMYLERSKAGRVKVNMESRDDIPAAPFTFAIPATHVDGSEPVGLDWQPVESGRSTEPDGSEDDAVMEAISQVMRAATEPLTLRGILRAVAGDDTRKKSALATLIAEGYIATQPGPRNATLHRSIRPYGSTVVDCGATVVDCGAHRTQTTEATVVDDCGATVPIGDSTTVTTVSRSGDASVTAAETRRANT